jgi:Methyltransferase domain
MAKTMNGQTKAPGAVMFKGWADLRTIYRAVKDTGLRNTLETVRKSLLYRLESYHGRRFDRKCNLDTAEPVYPPNLTTVSDNAHLGREYVATSVAVVRSTLSKLHKHDNLSDFYFIDFGSGKGRVLLIASEYNFKKVIGLEFAKELHEIAGKNIKKYKSVNQKCFNMESVCADACDYNIPDEKCVFYFFNPFKSSVLLRVLGNIRRSYMNHPRKMYLIYGYIRYSPDPECIDLFEGLDFAYRSEAIRLPLKLSLTKPYALRLYETQP